MSEESVPVMLNGKVVGHATPGGPGPIKWEIMDIVVTDKDAVGFINECIVNNFSIGSKEEK